MNSMVEKVNDKVIVSSKELTAFLLSRDFTLIKVYRNENLETKYVFLNTKGISKAILEFEDR